MMKSKPVTQILICSNHQANYKTPMLFTFAFKGAELWCPYCGIKQGMFDWGENVPETEELIERRKIYQSHYQDYLHAHGVTTCRQTQWKGKMIPPTELPLLEKLRLDLLRKNFWKSGITAESIKEIEPVK